MFQFVSQLEAKVELREEKKRVKKYREQDQRENREFTWSLYQCRPRKDFPEKWILAEDAMPNITILERNVKVLVNGSCPAL